MPNQQSKIIGYGLLTALSVILYVPFAEWMNANIQSGTIGDALGSFFWLVYPILILYLIFQLLVALLYG